MPDDMTHSLSDDAKRLVEPDRLVDPAMLAADPSLVPERRGIYGWWFRREALPDVPLEGTIVRDGLHLLYVGICPNGSNPDSRRTLRSRMKEHCRGPIRTSTLRRTLTALLADKLGLQVSSSASGKRLLLEDGETVLSRWMSQNVRVAWIEHEAPWLIEHELISTIAPPLNIMGSSHPHVERLKALRSRRGKTD